MLLSISNVKLTCASEPLDMTREALLGPAVSSWYGLTLPSARVRSRSKLGSGRTNRYREREPASIGAEQTWNMRQEPLVSSIIEDH